ncbi:MAG TPA: hypothetical protein VJ508_14615, partial [Saprospiraceae bacterium]|nr:hypothetical protein [Saprospiraceae bacterium]
MPRTLMVLVLLSMSMLRPLDAAGGSLDRKLVTEIAGIHVGVDSEKRVVSRYGIGSVVKNEGHLDGRYYTDSNHMLTLHVVTGVDYIIEDVELIRGKHVPEHFQGDIEISDELRLPISIQHGINLGMTRVEVTTILGDPDNVKVTAKGIMLSYSTSVDEDKRVQVNYDATYEFENDRLIRVSI